MAEDEENEDLGARVVGDLTEVACATEDDPCPSLQHTSCPWPSELPSRAPALRRSSQRPSCPGAPSSLPPDRPLSGGTPAVALLVGISDAWHQQHV
ncbi:MAG: hypothetical protein QGH82_06740 [Candidatus Woesearchaeota archaeon]|nr:hypothetical protein [Candidatus Woesearchaeota archaeon]